MVPTLMRWLVPAALCAAAPAAHSQNAAPAQLAAPSGTANAANAASPAASTARPDPLDAKAGTPALLYESPFARYRRWGDDKPTPWREANDNVTRIGGWRAYAREAQAPASAAAATDAGKPALMSSPTPSPTPAPLPAAGHAAPKSP